MNQCINCRNQKDSLLTIQCDHKICKGCLPALYEDFKVQQQQKMQFVHQNQLQCPQCHLVCKLSQQETIFIKGLCKDEQIYTPNQVKGNISNSQLQLQQFQAAQKQEQYSDYKTQEQINTQIYQQEILHLKEQLQNAINGIQDLLNTVYAKEKELNDQQTTITELIDKKVDLEQQISSLNESLKNEKQQQMNINKECKCDQNCIPINNKQQIIQGNSQDISADQFRTVQSNLNYNRMKQIQKRASLQNYQKEYTHSQNISQQIIELSKNFDNYRKVRGDGNCYYRALGFAYLEHLCRTTTAIAEVQYFLQSLESAKGYFQIRPQISKHKDLREKLIHLLQQILINRKQNTTFLETLEQQIMDNTNEIDDALV